MPPMKPQTIEHSPLVITTEAQKSHQTIVELLKDLLERDYLDGQTIFLSDLDGCLRYQPKLQNSLTFNFGRIHTAEIELMKAINGIPGLQFAVVTNQVTRGWFDGGFWGDGYGQQVSRLTSKIRKRIPGVCEITAFADFFANHDVPIFGGSTKFLLPTFLWRYKVTQAAIKEVGDWIGQSENFCDKEVLIMVGDWQSDMFFGKRLLTYLQRRYHFSGQGLFFLIDGKTKPNYAQMESLVNDFSSLSK